MEKGSDCHFDSCGQLCPCPHCNLVMGANTFVHVPTLMEAGCLSSTMNGVLINKAVIRETKNALGKNTHEFYYLITQVRLCVIWPHFMRCKEIIIAIFFM